MNNKMEIIKQSILDEADRERNKKLLDEEKENKKRKSEEAKIQKFNNYIQNALKDCYDSNISIIADNKFYGAIIAFKTKETETYAEDFYYVRMELETWEDRGSDESPLETYSKYILGLYPDGWGTKPEVSCDIPTKYYEYLEQKEFKKKIDEFIKNVYKFLAKESLKLGRTV